MSIAVRPAPAREECLRLDASLAEIDAVVLLTDGLDGRVARAVLPPDGLRVARMRELLELHGVERLEVVPVREIRDITGLVLRSR